MSDLLASGLVTPDARKAPIMSLPNVSILASVPLSRFSLRLRENNADKTADAFGIEMPQVPLTSSVAPGRAALWMGPDEWTLLVSEEDGRDVFGKLEESLTGLPHALVDISDRSEAIIVSGDRAVWLLNTGIFLDFSPTSFPVGNVTRTLFHKAPVQVWRTGLDTFVIEAWGSFMEYVTGLLVQSAGELEVA